MSDIGLVQKNSLKLTASLKMQESLKILQMNADELTVYLKQQAISNPFIELEEREPKSLEDLAANDSPQNLDDANHWQQDNSRSYERRSASAISFDNVAAKKIGLKEHLYQQINLLNFDSKEHFVAIQYIDNLDENGYLNEQTMSILNALKIDAKIAERVLSSLQKLEPSGVFARNLKECLKIQLAEKKLFTGAMKVVLENLDLLARGETKKLIKIIGMDEKALQNIIKEIKKLDPKPGRNFGNDIVRYITADAIILRDQNDSYRILINDFNLPNIVINNSFYNCVMARIQTKPDAKYCRINIQSAKWLSKAIKQRNETLIKALKVVIEQQWEFFDKGFDYLKPMTISDVAKKIGVHESTVSRLSNKYIASPLGLIEIKSFFNNSLSTNYSDDQISTTIIKNKIYHYIKGEQKVLSDDGIADLLKDEGINISRRTVTKYREQLKLPSSHQRKRTARIN